MSGNKFNTPEFMKLKGYKYRAKMIIAAAVILAVIVILICLAVHGIASAVSGKSKSESGGDTQASSVSVTSSQSSSAADSDKEVYASVSSIPANDEYDFDADGKLIIDTDTLDGKKAVALTFDDGPGPYTQKLLEGLAEKDVKATFFMLGSCVAKYPEVLSMMADGGHQLGSHTYDHKDITKLTANELNEQLTKTDNEIYNACGQYPTAFRPPYGAYTDDSIHNIDKTVTFWSVDTQDWEVKNAEKVKTALVSKVTDGDIVLLHDIYDTTVDGTLAAIDELKAKGFVFVTVDELMERYGYTVSHGKPHHSQYSVYETNSPKASKYESEMMASQNVASSSPFYYNSGDTSANSGTDYTNSTVSNTDSANSSDVTVSSTESQTTETDSSKLIY